MTEHLNPQTRTNFKRISDFIWQVADEVLRDDIKRGKYPDVILPFTVLRRLDCVLAPTKAAVLQMDAELAKKGLRDRDGALRRVARCSFYNTCRYDFENLTDDPANLAKNLRAYINGFSGNMRDVLDRFKFRTTIDTLDEKGLLYGVMRKFRQVDLHPETVDNHTMGTIFEELIRRFNEQSNENPGEHFTPREVVRLMVRLVVNGDAPLLQREGVTRSVYDPACGTGGMLSLAKDYVRTAINPRADLVLYGQEVNDETYAICKSDLLMKGDDRDAGNIRPGSTLSDDGLVGEVFDYMLTNPPYGKDWKKDKDHVEAEARRGSAGRFAAGLPRISDGQMLFLQHMLAKMKPVADGGSRIAIVMNGSPLFTGDAGSGESEIRRWILENDWLESIVALPGELFYNTGIATYVWVLSNRPKARPRTVVLVNGAAARKENGSEADVFARRMKKSLGQKRKELSEESIERLARLAESEGDGLYAIAFPATEFGYRKITVERPLRLSFAVSPERVGRLKQEPGFVALGVSRKKGGAGAEEAARGEALKQDILDVIGSMEPDRLWLNRDEFRAELTKALRNNGVPVTAAVVKVLVAGLSERDGTADICVDSAGKREADPDLRDYEYVPLAETVEDYFAREVTPHLPDAWINESVRDHRDGNVGKVGYEVNFNRYFYHYEPPRPLEAIEAEIQALEEEIRAMVLEVTR